MGTENREIAASVRAFDTGLLWSERCGGEDIMMHDVRTKESKPKNEKSRSGSLNVPESASGMSMMAGSIGIALNMTCTSIRSTT